GLLGVAQTPGIDWIRWIVSVVCAVGVISVFETVTGRKK
ncbi:MAG: Membrane protein, partial [Actinomyces urogenitalis DORA_12]